MVESILRKTLTDEQMTLTVPDTIAAVTSAAHRDKVFFILEEFAQQLWLEFRSCVRLVGAGRWDSFLTPVPLSRSGTDTTRTNNYSYKHLRGSDGFS